eukprot:TRINITY_DN5461_c0_g1_i11.p1 TRINITY_DN5461_c0_g1~~TRINITY_DN5461_c0_g1_i11.p1  ORF type:complete len:219 (+),score=24.84 TRINITY_DN5461_c0_g1_i11:114-770(+)
MGLEAVGWVVATLPRSGEKYKGSVLMSGAEVKTAARFQERYKNSETGYSRFVTVILEHAKQIEPKAYQVSDQCVAMERDGILVKAKDPYMLAGREAKPGELVPHIVYHDTQLKAGEEFLPDDFIVKVILSTNEVTSSYLFKHHDFPSDGTDVHMRNLLRTKQEPYHQKLSDFNVLIYCGKTLGMPLTRRICEGLRTKQAFSSELQGELDRAFSKNNLF